MIVRRHAANVTTVNLFWFVRDLSLLNLVRYSLLYLQSWWNDNLYMLLLCSGCFAVTFLILFQNYSCNYILQRRLLEMSNSCMFAQAIFWNEAQGGIVASFFNLAYEDQTSMCYLHWYSNFTIVVQNINRSLTSDFFCTL